MFSMQQNILPSQRTDWQFPRPSVKRGTIQRQLWLSTALALLLSFCLFNSPVQAAPAGAGNARPLAQAALCNPSTDVGGVVFRDFNVNGTREPNERGVNGNLAPVVISAIAPGGQTVVTTTVGVTGTYTLGPIDLSNGVRVEFSGLPEWMQPSPFGGPNGGAETSGTLVQFVDAPGCNVDLGVNNPVDYCDDNPDLATTCFINGDPLAGGSSGEQDVVYAWPYNRNGWWFDYPSLSATADPPNSLAINSQMGSTWGLAWERATKTLFTAAMLKRHAGFGPLGPGGIYATDYSSPTAPIVTEFLDLNSLPGIDVGSNPRTTPLPADIGQGSNDPEAFGLIGKMALGDMDISEDETTLLVMNLFQRELIGIDIVSRTVTSRTPVPDPGCMDSRVSPPAPAPDDRRPWAVRVHDGETYIGVVCSAETSQLQEDLHAYIMQQDGNTFTSIFDFPLDYPKGIVSEGNEYPGTETRTGWFPWTDDFNATITENGETLVYPQPILSNMEVDDDGSVIVGFVDRMGHQGGRRNRSTDPSDPNLYNAHSGGDTLRVCVLDRTLVLEGSSARCPSNASNMEGPNGGEFYFQDDFAVQGGLLHNETSLGGLAFLSGSGEVAATNFDAVHHLGNEVPSPYPRTNGVRFFSNMDGRYIQQDGLNRAYEVIPDTDLFSVGFAKAASMGDLELLCDEAPVEIGNYVWLDTNRNGIQDADETPLAGVMVELLSPTGELLATATTDANGQYYFSSDARRTDESTDSAIYGVEGLTLNTDDYEIRIPLDQTVLNGLFVTLANATGDTSNDNKTDLNDSDGIEGNGFSAVTFGVGAAGVNNHNMDFGFANAPTALEEGEEPGWLERKLFIPWVRQ